MAVPPSELGRGVWCYIHGETSHIVQTTQSLTQAHRRSDVDLQALDSCAVWADPHIRTTHFRAEDKASSDEGMQPPKSRYAPVAKKVDGTWGALGKV